MVFAPASDSMIQIVDTHSERRTMKEKKPQILLIERLRARTTGVA